MTFDPAGTRCAERQGRNGASPNTPCSGARCSPGRRVPATAAPSGTGSVWRSLRGSILVAALLLGSGSSTAVLPQTSPPSRDLPDDLTQMSLEELVTIKVTSVSRRPQPLSKAAAAIYVVTQEDIRRSGATSIPEALRMVPGLHVGHIDANKWAVSSRGFNGRFANKLLVLIDGRTVYTPSFAGMYWETNEVPLEDIDRIEVIRGPGATMWGSNAVNGVINIITKHARDTQGVQLTSGAGNQERAFGYLRYGAKAGANTHYRVYSDYFNRDNFNTASGREARDRWAMARGGFRLDWENLETDSLMLQGDIYQGRAGQTLQTPILRLPFVRSVDDTARPSGGHLLARWTRRHSETSETVLQGSYARFERPELSTTETSDTFDLDLQQRFAISGRQEFTWGLGYRFNTSEITDTFLLSFNDSLGDSHLYTAFVQDEFTLLDGRLSLMLGSRLEHNSFTGFELQPTARVLWTVTARHSVWAAVSRAVRAAARTDQAFRFNIATFPQNRGLGLLAILGNRDVQSEKVRAHEIGYRFQTTKRISFDTAAFYSVYHDLRSVEPGLPFFEESPPPPHLVIPLGVANGLRGETYGAEVAANWVVNESWRLSATYSWIEMQLHREPSSQDASSETMEGETPRRQAHLRSYLDLPWKLQLDAALYYVDSLPSPNIPSYLRADARLGWRPRRALDLSLVLQNLLDNQHPEFSSLESGLVRPSQVRRGAYGKITWRF